MENERTMQIRVYGIVQGVGFRPTVSRHAMTSGIRGSVSNKGPYVEIQAQGSEKQIADFLELLKKQPPKRAAILKISTELLDDRKADIPSYDSFEIVESEKTKGEIFVSPDIAICEECKEELYNPKDRRYLHPFINCTCCGPRLTILEELPYDRERTSMKEFLMCPECEAEYTNPESRRYDAQPVCCNECGPQVYLIGREERGEEAITYARRTIASGGIVAVKGIGGFHLCCDATNEAAVETLRKRKRRPMKPFAVMARDLEVVQRECIVGEQQKEILTGHQKPILLLKRRKTSKKSPEKRLCDAVAPENPKVGMMLPYAPVQLLLFQYEDEVEMPDLLVMTSGNISGAPICRDDREAIEELSDLCDCMLSHDRKILIRADDSVMDFYQDEPYMIRRSRGYAPLPVLLSQEMKGQVLAIGGELKNTFCVGSENRFYPSPYVGDLEDLRTVKALRETSKRLSDLLEVTPEVVACDFHPKYNSTRVAEEMGLPVVKVQHHYAHILSCMAENDCSDPVIGVSFDGTGYGTDGTVWGGEILLADYHGFERYGSIEPFLQTGGDVSAKEGWRIAVSLIYSLTKDREKAVELIRKLNLCSETEAKVQLTMTERKINAVSSTSAGRLFDGISAILGIRHSSTFEGEASMALEFAAEEYETRQKSLQEAEVENGTNEREKIYKQKTAESGTKQERERKILPTLELVREAVETAISWIEKDENRTGSESDDEGKKDIEKFAKDMKKLSREKAAYEFHRELAEQIVEVCEQARVDTGRKTVALSGGVFQNRLLLKMTEEGLRAREFQVLRHRMIPPNDGGIALGQAVYAMEYLKTVHSHEGEKKEKKQVVVHNN